MTAITEVSPLSASTGIGTLAASDAASTALRDEATCEQLFVVIRHQIRPGTQPQYENWLRHISKVAARQSGHMGVQINRPHGGGHEYTIVLRFADGGCAQSWLASGERTELLAELQPLLARAEHVEHFEGIDFWFTPAVAATAVRWKQWVVTTLVIWPLTLLVPWVLAPLLGRLALPPVWTQGLVVAVVVALVVYVVMPRVMRLVAPWVMRRPQQG